MNIQMYLDQLKKIEDIDQKVIFTSNSILGNPKVFNDYFDQLSVKGKRDFVQGLCILSNDKQTGLSYIITNSFKSTDKKSLKSLLDKVFNFNNQDTFDSQKYSFILKSLSRTNNPNALSSLISYEPEYFKTLLYYENDDTKGLIQQERQFIMDALLIKNQNRNAFNIIVNQTPEILENLYEQLVTIPNDQRNNDLFKKAIATSENAIELLIENRPEFLLSLLEDDKKLLNYITLNNTKSFDQVVNFLISYEPPQYDLINKKFNELYQTIDNLKIIISESPEVLLSLVKLANYLVINQPENQQYTEHFPEYPLVELLTDLYNDIFEIKNLDAFIDTLIQPINESKLNTITLIAAFNPAAVAYIYEALVERTTSEEDLNKLADALRVPFDNTIYSNNQSDNQSNLKTGLTLLHDMLPNLYENLKDYGQCRDENPFNQPRPLFYNDNYLSEFACNQSWQND
ncbi:hypothetical protein L3V83_02630 [Thiotrichales bacterium 19X7-9]|nr:hypothetical protein [Thiotrichales bacterium 19X7-9]